MVLVSGRMCTALSNVISSGYFYSLDQNGAHMYYMTLSLSFTCYLKLVLYPQNQCSSAQTVRKSGPFRYSLHFVHRVAQKDYQRRLMPCRSNIMDIGIIYCRITALSATVTCMVHRVSSFSLARYMYEH